MLNNDTTVNSLPRWKLCISDARPSLRLHHGWCCVHNCHSILFSIISIVKKQDWIHALQIWLWDGAKVLKWRSQEDWYWVPNMVRSMVCRLKQHYCYQLGDSVNMIVSYLHKTLHSCIVLTQRNIPKYVGISWRTIKYLIHNMLKFNLPMSNFHPLIREWVCHWKFYYCTNRCKKCISVQNRQKQFCNGLC